MSYVKIYGVIALLVICVKSFGQNTLIPDPAFEQALIVLGLDPGFLDGSVPTASIDTVTKLDVKTESISDLTGIEDFSSLVELNCEYNDLTNINVTQNSSLQKLWCFGNQITNLNVTQNLLLRELQCANNQLTSLNVSQNIALETLGCHINQLSNIDVSQNPNLTILGCGQNQIDTLDVTSNSALEQLYCEWNQLTEIDVSQNPNLVQFGLSNNQISELDLSQNIDLEALFCSYNQLNTLELSFCPNLRRMQCEGNILWKLDLSLHTSIFELDCSDNSLSCLNMNSGNNWSMWYLDATGNPNLTCIEVFDVSYANSEWTSVNGSIDSTATFSNFCNNVCSTVGIQDTLIRSRQLMYITDILGRHAQLAPNQVLIYHYSDGSTEKRIILEL